MLMMKVTVVFAESLCVVVEVPPEVANLMVQKFRQVKQGNEKWTVEAIANPTEFNTVYFDYQDVVMLTIEEVK